MLKNYNKDGQKLPLFGIGPYMIFGMGIDRTILSGIHAFYELEEFHLLMIDNHIPAGAKLY